MELKSLFGFGKTEEKKEYKASAISFGQQVQDNSIYKAYIPEFLYKPFFGYPRSVNILQLRKLALNPYVFSVIKTIYDEAANVPFNLVEKEGVEVPEEIKEAKVWFLKWLNDPNGNFESWGHILKGAIKDILELDSGVWVKVFNNLGQLTQLFARDGGSFLMNPDIYGYMGNRADFVKPVGEGLSLVGATNPSDSVIKQYSIEFNNLAAYYQYGYTFASLPVPFGKREVMYFMANPRTDSVYGRSPIEILIDTIMTLIDGAKYNLDFYMNRNIPDGILKLEGIQPDEIDAVRNRMNERHQVEDEFGFTRNIRGAIPITGMPAEFVNFNLSPGDMEVIAQQEWFTKVLWMSFGVNSNEMGVTDSVNKASAEAQSKINVKKALLPILKLFEYKVQTEVMIEEILYTNLQGEKITIPPLYEFYDFVFDEYDLGEDIKRHSLLQTQINMGIKTAEMVAEEEGIDVDMLKEQKEEKRVKDMESQLNTNFFNNEKPKQFGNEKVKPKIAKKEEKDEMKSEVKAADELSPIKNHIRDVAKELADALDQG